MRTIPATPEGGTPPNNKKVTPLPQRDSVTGYQVHTLLEIAGTMLGALLHDTLASAKPELDGGAKDSAAATFINACGRLDDILADKSRWTLEAHDTLERQLSEMYAQNTEFYKQQTKAAAEVNSPHFRYRPLLLKISPPSKPTEYAAILGNPMDLDNCIVGVGTTPQKALEAFDGMFVGEITDDLAKWLAEREAAIDAGQAPVLALPEQEKKPKQRRKKTK